ncbi:MAG: four helix bundle protein [Planctomycetaceae bacterium]|nr:four helix bundle protein [Planctomycetaceae bacterium]
MPSFRFEKLTGWQKAVDYADAVYTASEGFPKDERFGLTSQIRRAVVSVSSNIAEGCGRLTDADQARFIEFAYGSLMETVSQLHIARRRDFIEGPSFDDLRNKAEELARILSGLRSRLRKP